MKIPQFMIVTQPATMFKGTQKQLYDIKNK